MLLYLLDLCYKYELDGQPLLAVEDLQSAATYLNMELNRKKESESLKLVTSTASKFQKTTVTSQALYHLAKTKLGSEIMIALVEAEPTYADFFLQQLKLNNRLETICKNVYGYRLVKYLADLNHTRTHIKSDELINYILKNLISFSMDNKYSATAVMQLIKAYPDIGPTIVRKLCSNNVVETMAKNRNAALAEGKKLS